MIDYNQATLYYKPISKKIEYWEKNEYVKDRKNENWLEIVYLFRDLNYLRFRFYDEWRRTSFEEGWKTNRIIPRDIKQNQGIHKACQRRKPLPSVHCLPDVDVQPYVHVSTLLSILFLHEPELLMLRSGRHLRWSMPQTRSMHPQYKCQHSANGYTITSENHLYCDRKDARSLIQSVFGLGSMLGVLFVSFFSDYQGRKFSLIIALVCQLMATLLLFIGSYYDIVSLFMVSMVMAGFGTNSLLPVSYVYLNKILSKIWADRSILLMNGIG